MYARLHFTGILAPSCKAFSLQRSRASTCPVKRPKDPENRSLQSTAPICELGRWLPFSGKDNPIARPFPELVHPCRGSELLGPRILGRDGA